MILNKTKTAYKIIKIEKSDDSVCCIEFYFQCIMRLTRKALRKRYVLKSVG